MEVPKNIPILVCIESLLGRRKAIGAFVQAECQKEAWEEEAMMGNQAIRDGEMDRAIAHYQEAKKIVEKSENREMLAILLEILGNLYESILDTSSIHCDYRFIEHYRSASKAWEDTRQPLFAASLYSKLAKIYEKNLIQHSLISSLEVAIQYYKKAKDCFRTAGAVSKTLYDCNLFQFQNRLCNILHGIVFKRNRKAVRKRQQRSICGPA
ncbi:MAG: hypothetical protein HUU50_01400 [Candidatus Brocadiae bacterium]|nr:hypothetical protein [Candidatus Brocadiia bacterium]